jgi:hypothetical protein
MSELRLVEITDILQLWLQCDSHQGKTLVPVADFSTDDRIASFFHEHTHLSSSPAGMREDLEELSKLLRRFATTDIIKIREIAERRKFTIGFEIGDTGRTEQR